MPVCLVGLGAVNDRVIVHRIRGMDCAEEVDALRKALSHLVQISDLQFDLLNGTMTVVAPAGSISDEAIRAAVRKAGLEAVPWDPDRLSARDEPETFWRRRGRATLCAASGVLTATGFVAHALMSRSLMAALAAGEVGADGFPAGVVACYAAAALCGLGYVLPKAVAAIRSLSADMHLLMTVAVIGASAIGQWFEAASVSFLFALSLLLESWSVGRARHAIRALLDIAPRQARYYGPEDGEILTRPVEEVPVGVVALVRPGERIPLDGTVTAGTTTVNQAPITGESAPVSKGPGDPVFAGTINNDGAFEFRTTKPANDTTLARIIHMVEKVQSRRAAAEQWVGTFARYYTPAMLGVAALTAIVPPLAFGASWADWFYQALVMLVIACPCALVISTPVSIVAGLTAAARAGVLIKGGAYLEAPGRVRVFAFDKTGTLTRGQPDVQRIVPLSGHTERELLERAAALEAPSAHPLARAILRRAAAEGVAMEPASDYRALKGQGAEARIGGREFWIGSHRLMHEKADESPELHRMAQELEDAGHSVVAVGNENHVCGLITVADGVRAGAAEAIRRLKALGIESVVMLTGDNNGTAGAVARSVGADSFQAELLPEDKVAAVEALVRKHRHVAMVGDGVNDAPAMAAASVSIAMGAAGSDAAIETADVSLMSDDLSRLPWLVLHSRRTLAIVRQNIMFALGVKALFMALALAGIATLWMAIAADMGASLLVIFNALRLLDASAIS